MSNSRYSNNKSKKLNDGREVYKSKIYPTIPLQDSDLYIVTQTGDRIDTLAYQFLGDSSLWWIIASANKIHDSSLAFKDGTILRMPQDFRKIINDFNK
jgi:hypothetical protein